MSLTLTFTKPLGKKFTLNIDTLRALQRAFIGSRLYNLADMAGVSDKTLKNAGVLIIRRGADLLADADSLMKELKSDELANVQFELLRAMLVHYVGDSFSRLEAKQDPSERSIYFHGTRSLNTVTVVRLGKACDLNFQWFKDNKPVGLRVNLPPGLRHGDICLFTDIPTKSPFVLYYSLDVVQDPRTRKAPIPVPPVVVKSK